MAKGLRVGNKIYPDKIICDGCRKEIDIDTEEIRCSKCVSNLIEYIKKLELQISSLKSQLADIKYLSEYEIDKAIFGQMDYDEYGNIIDFNANKAAQAICKLALPDIDRDRITKEIEHESINLIGVIHEIIQRCFIDYEKLPKANDIKGKL